MLGEEHLAARDAEVRGDDAAHPYFLAQRVLHRFGKGPPGARKGAEGASKNALELQHRTLVEDDGVERVRLDAGVIETPFDRRQRKRGVALAPRKAFLLDGAVRHAVDDQCRGGVVVVRGDAENLHLSTAAAESRCVPARWPSNLPSRAATRAWRAMRTAEGPRNSGSSAGRSRARRRARWPDADMPSTGASGALSRFAGDDARERHERVA